MEKCLVGKFEFSQAELIREYFRKRLDLSFCVNIRLVLTNEFRFELDFPGAEKCFYANM